MLRKNYWKSLLCAFQAVVQGSVQHSLLVHPHLEPQRLVVHCHLVQILHLEEPRHLEALLKVALAPHHLGGTLYIQSGATPFNSGHLSNEQRPPASFRISFCYQVRGVCIGNLLILLVKM